MEQSSSLSQGLFEEAYFCPHTRDHFLGPGLITITKIHNHCTWVVEEGILSFVPFLFFFFFFLSSFFLFFFIFFFFFFFPAVPFAVGIHRPPSDPFCLISWLPSPPLVRRMVEIPFSIFSADSCFFPLYPSILIPSSGWSHLPRLFFFPPSIRRPLALAAPNSSLALLYSGILHV